MVTDVSVMAGKELGVIFSPNCLICCSEPAGSREPRTGGGE